MTVTHKALVPLDGPPRPACGGTGRSVARPADVTCPACLALAFGATGAAEVTDAAHEQAHAEMDAQFAEVHDAHAIPGGGEPDHLAAFLAQQPTPGDLFVDRKNQPYFVVDDDGRDVVMNAAGEWCDPAVVCEHDGPLTRARIVAAEPLLTGSEVLDSLADETSVHYLTGLECRTALGLAQETAPEALAAAIAQVLAQRTTS